LGLGDLEDRLVPARVGGKEVVNGVQVLMAACGDWHTLAVTKAGDLWSWGEGEDGVLGHNNANDRLMPTQVEAQYFGNAKIVSAAAGESHSAAITELGALYSWGMGMYPEKKEERWGAGVETHFQEI